jgi:hypothetical protein
MISSAFGMTKAIQGVLQICIGWRVLDRPIQRRLQAGRSCGFMQPALVVGITVAVPLACSSPRLMTCQAYDGQMTN